MYMYTQYLDVHFGGYCTRRHGTLYIDRINRASASYSSTICESMLQLVWVAHVLCGTNEEWCLVRVFPPLTVVCRMSQ